MLNELKIHYRTLEMVVGNAPPSQPNQENHLDQGVYSTSPTKPRQQHQHLNKGQGKGQGRNSYQAPQSNRPPAKPTAVHKSAPMPLSCLPRWTCPLSCHENHTTQSCPEFFSLSAKERRRRMKKLPCFTCFGCGGPCHNYQCGRIREVPPDTICRACLETARASESSPSHLLCGLAHHVKPDKEKRARAHESWIP
jgi:hypothetical protein